MLQTIFVDPIYNAFIYLIGVMPGGDVGLAIITLTLATRIILYPLFTASIKTQMGMQAAQPELDEINKKYKGNTQEQSTRTMEVYKKYGINPFSLIFSSIAMFGLIISLYYAMFREGFPTIHTMLLYPFVHAPAVVSTNFFGLMNVLGNHNIVLAILVGATQYLAIRLTVLRTPIPQGNPEKEMAARMQRRIMLYFLPVTMLVVSFLYPATVGLYFVTGNLFSFGQELLLRRKVTAARS